MTVTASVVRTSGIVESGHSPIECRRRLRVVCRLSRRATDLMTESEPGGPTIVRVFDFQPVPRFAAAIDRVESLGDHAFEVVCTRSARRVWSMRYCLRDTCSSYTTASCAPLKVRHGSLDFRPEPERIDAALQDAGIDTTQPLHCPIRRREDDSGDWARGWLYAFTSSAISSVTATPLIGRSTSSGHRATEV